SSLGVGVWARAGFLRMGRGILRLLRSTFPAPLVLACDRIFDRRRIDPWPAVFIALALRVHSFGCVAGACWVSSRGPGYFEAASINISCPARPRLRQNFRLQAQLPQAVFIALALRVYNFGFVGA